ncbi:MAG TPA: class I SAM-dependent rRNA methyltransferase [Candidatus Tidjanibacter faecipullorum]|uniref:Class I SAM-dependent rRNA methyltransferase n=1 Tax=Candidatus Tidjanibacter faecipullorum TaxID=2838766 RepID=A0A9D2IL74_9BACT|nr:class I SAM-dependent rRNA methyltransferase [Candidatus Tidjanibacter faecipullorum]
MNRIFLKRGKEESLARRHPWIFSGAIERIEGDPEEGDVVDVYARSGEFLARGHYQIGSITVRVLSFEQEEIDAAWWEARLRAAWAVRRAIGLIDSPDTDCYRLVHGEGDNLPGLVIDIYGDVAVVQAHSVGMYRSRQAICEALRTVYGDRLAAVYDKSAQTLPYKAETGAVDGYLYGGGASTERIVTEHGNRFHVDWGVGQKTGFFLDQRENRALVGHYSAGRTVLNTFSYTGGFSVYALAGGAREVVSVDSSATAVALAVRNAELNFGPDVHHEGVASDVFDYLKTTDKQFDLIILDPPAFAKHHKVLGNATKGYTRLNARALSQIAPGGILFTFSCSQAVSRELFRTTVFTAAAIAGRRVRILHQLTQPADHPVNIYHPEGEYLKGLVLYVE